MIIKKCALYGSPGVVEPACSVAMKVRTLEELYLYPTAISFTPLDVVAFIDIHPSQPGLQHTFKFLFRKKAVRYFDNADPFMPTSINGLSYLDGGKPRVAYNDVLTVVIFLLATISILCVALLLHEVVAPSSQCFHSTSAFLLFPFEPLNLQETHYSCSLKIHLDR
jgi:hypothetical protein